MSKTNPLRHLTGLVSDFAFLDKCTASLREKGMKQHTRKYNERYALELARQFALEDAEAFTDFCDAQCPTQGKILFNALRRVRLENR